MIGWFMNNVIKVLTAASMKITAFSAVAQFGLGKMSDISEVRVVSVNRANIVLIMGSVRTSETSVCFHRTA
jgi:hypothetical protein